jgi:TetR/AcrR family transcriptional regulator, mexJK operon transcriptional repressor
MCDTEMPTAPRGLLRREAMLEAAWQAVLEKGFSGVTLMDILKHSGGSKATLYKWFGDKDGLLKESIEHHIQDFYEQLHITLNADQDPIILLRHFAQTYVERITQPDAIRFLHLLMSDSQHIAPLTRQFLENGPMRTQKLLAAFLKECSVKGPLKISDPDRAADLLLTMLQGQYIFNIFNHCVLDEQLESYRKTAKDRAHSAVDLFLKATLN